MARVRAMTALRLELWCGRSRPAQCRRRRDDHRRRGQGQDLLVSIADRQRQLDRRFMRRRGRRIHRSVDGPRLRSRDRVGRSCPTVWAARAALGTDELDASRATFVTLSMTPHARVTNTWPSGRARCIKSAECRVSYDRRWAVHAGWILQWRECPHRWTHDRVIVASIKALVHHSIAVSLLACRALASAR